MDRHNVILDDGSIDAARWLLHVHGLRSVSAALRYAVRAQAALAGWKPVSDLSQIGRLDPDNDCATMPGTAEGKAS